MLRRTSWRVRVAFSLGDGDAGRVSSKGWSVCLLISNEAAFRSKWRGKIEYDAGEFIEPWTRRIGGGVQRTTRSVGARSVEGRIPGVVQPVQESIESM